MFNTQLEISDSNHVTLQETCIYVVATALADGLIHLGVSYMDVTDTIKY